MLSVRNIHKRFGDIEVLKGIDLEVERGDVVTILGPSGSGKTTLLRCINFLERADEGRIALEGIELDAHSATKKQVHRYRRHTGFVFQNYNLFRNKTALENVAEGLVVSRKMKRQEAADIARGHLERVGLGERLDAYPSQLSGGQQQRVGIARAMALDPDVVFFDEPTSSLDPELVGEVLAVMKELARSGTTMVVVTHEINFACEVGTHALFMEGGVVVEEGTPDKVVRNPDTLRAREFFKRFLAPEYSI